MMPHMTRRRDRDPGELWHGGPLPVVAAMEPGELLLDAVLNLLGLVEEGVITLTVTLPPAPENATEGVLVLEGGERREEGGTGATRRRRSVTVTGSPSAAGGFSGAVSAMELSGLVRDWAAMERRRRGGTVPPGPLQAAGGIPPRGENPAAREPA